MKIDSYIDEFLQKSYYGSQTPLTFIWGPLYLFFTIPSNLSPGSSMLYNHRSR